MKKIGTHQNGVYRVKPELPILKEAPNLKNHHVSFCGRGHVRTNKILDRTSIPNLKPIAFIMKNLFLIPLFHLSI